MALRIVHMHDGAAAVGNGATVPVSGRAGVLLEISGISGDTITVEGKLRGSWDAIDSYAMSGGGRSTTIGADGKYWVPTPGLKAIRARISAYGSGDITVIGGATGIAYGNIPS